jgi:phosphonate degradation associated HDIG domain protein
MMSAEDQAEEILKLLSERGDSEYGNEAVTQLEHALQTAELAAEQDADDCLITAALLHDIGHMLHELPEDAPDHGIDDRHEITGAHWLESRFSPEVSEPVGLHVPAKRYLCAIDPVYHDGLSEPSRQSLVLQGGKMGPEEVAVFEKNPHYKQAVRLRLWDDEAKVQGKATRPLQTFRPHLVTALERSSG